MTKITVSNEAFATLLASFPEPIGTDTIVITTWYRGIANKPIEVVRDEKPLQTQ